MSKLNKAQLHQRPTYESLVKDSILEPKDKIALPDRTATILRKTQQLTRYDDVEFLDIDKDNEMIAKEKAQQAMVHAAAAVSTGSISQTQAAQTGPHQGHTFVNPPVDAQPSTQGQQRFHRSRPPTRGQPSTHNEMPTPQGRPQSFAPAASSSSAPAASGP